MVDSKRPKTLDNVLDRRLLFVSGKGGVGKTTIAGALALRAAELGKRTLLCEVTADSAFKHVFDSPSVGFEPSRLQHNIWAALLDPTQSLVSFLTRFVKIKRVAKALVSNRVARRFFDAAPGVLETVVLERIGHFLNHDSHRYGHFDLVIVDLPSSGHAVSFLDVPRAMAKVIKVGALAQHLNELADLIADPQEVELLLVALPEEMPVRETIELWDLARERLQVAITTIIMNRMRSTGVSEEEANSLRSLEVPRDSHPLLKAAKLTATWEERDREFAELLRTSIPVEHLEVPWLPEHHTERDLIKAVQEALVGGEK